MSFCHKSKSSRGPCLAMLPSSLITRVKTFTPMGNYTHVPNKRFYSQQSYSNKRLEGLVSKAGSQILKLNKKVINSNFLEHNQVDATFQLRIFETLRKVPNARLVVGSENWLSMESLDQLVNRGPGQKRLAMGLFYDEQQPVDDLIIYDLVKVSEAVVYSKCDDVINLEG